MNKIHSIPILNKLSKETLAELLEIDIEIDLTVTNPDTNINHECLFGYMNPTHGNLLNFASMGDGGMFLIWYQDEKEIETSPVVYIGSEGELARVAESISQFFEFTFIFKCYFSDVISRLPGSSCDTDIEIVKENPKFGDEICTLLEYWNKNDSKFKYKQASNLLQKIHLKRPRFVLKILE